MGKHISFIENVYTIVKTPLEYFLEYFNQIALPDIQMKDIPDIQMKDILNN